MSRRFINVALVWILALGCGYAHSQTLQDKSETQRTGENSQASTKVASDTTITQTGPAEISIHGNSTQSLEGEPEDDVATRIAEDARVLAVASLVVSVVAVLLSGIQFLYERHKDKQQRRQSIEDEYWFRAVLGPSAIEPLIAHTHNTCSTLPVKAALKPGDLMNVYDAFMNNYRHEHAQIVSKLMMITMFDGELYRRVVEKIDEIEDVVIIHCSVNRAPIPPLGSNRVPSFDRSEVTQVIYGKLTEALKIIRQSHHRL